MQNKPILVEEIDKSENSEWARWEKIWICIMHLNFLAFSDKSIFPTRIGPKTVLY